jgi:hypothetical protein
MIRIIYNPTTGEIQIMSQGYRGPETRPYIEIPHDPFFNMSLYKVNLQTLELEEIT